MCSIRYTDGCETETLILSRSHEKVICCVTVVQGSVHRARLVDIVRALKLHYQSTSGCLFLLSLHRSSPPCLSVDSSGHTRHHLDGMSDGVQTREDREGGLARHLMLSQTIYTLRNSSLRSHWLEIVPPLPRTASPTPEHSNYDLLVVPITVAIPDEPCDVTMSAWS